LREEVQQEGLTRNLGAFSRFLEVASFSQAQVLNISAVARECAIHQKVAENYFSILDDLLIAQRLPVFAKKAKRRLASHAKFFFFDIGVYRTLRPKGPLDSPEEIEGAALETLFFQELRAANHYHDLGYHLYYWRTAAGQEVDFVLYGEKGIIALEIKRKKNYSESDLKGLRAFANDYPQAKCYLLCATERVEYKGNITVMPIEKALGDLKGILS
jgi:predicted AAA+ superfamily ATPase